MVTAGQDVGTVTSLPLKKLTSYVQQLRSFLPDTVRREGRQEDRKKDSSFSELEENYVSMFIDKSLVTDWDKLNPKVRAYIVPSKQTSPLSLFSGGVVGEADR